MDAKPDLAIEVRPSSIHGNGVFAKRTFKPGEVILRWDVSRLIDKADVSLLPETERHYTHPYDNDRLVLVQPPERFVNHSCNNNTEVCDFCDVAIRYIAPGEEITSNYSSDGQDRSLSAPAALRTVAKRSVEV